MDIIFDFITSQVSSIVGVFEGALSSTIQLFVKAIFKCVCYFLSGFCYIIAVFLLQILDFVQLLFRSLSGLNNDTLLFSIGKSPANSDALIALLRSDVVVTAFCSCCIVGIFILILSTIFQIIKVEYTSEGSQNAKGPFIAKMLKGIANIILVPVLSIFGVFLGNQVLKVVDTATGGGGKSSLGSTLFVASASNAMWDKNGCPEKLKVYLGTVLTVGNVLVPGAGLPMAAVSLGIADTFEAEFLIPAPLGDGDDTYRGGIEGKFKDGELSYTNVFEVLEYYNIFNINYVAMILAASIVMKTMFTVCFGLIDRLFSATTLFIISPMVIGFSPIHDSTSVWRSAFIAKIMAAYGVVVGVNILYMLIDVFMNMSISLDPTLASRLLFSSSEVVACIRMLFVVSACTILEKIIADVGSYLGGGSALTEGMAMYGEIKKGVKTTTTVIKIGAQIAMTVASIAASVGSFGAATPAAGAAVANTARGVATAGKGIAAVTKGAADAAKAARVAKGVADGAKKGSSALKKGKEIYDKIKKVTDNVAKVKEKADGIIGLFTGGGADGEGVDEQGLMDEHDEAFGDIDDMDEFNNYKNDRDELLTKMDQSQGKIDDYDKIINDPTKHTKEKIEDAQHKKDEELAKMDNDAEDFASKYSDEQIDKYERGISAQNGVDVLDGLKQEAKEQEETRRKEEEEKQESKKKLRRDKAMTTYNALKEWGKSGLESLIPGPIKDITSGIEKSAENGAKSSPEGQQAWENVKEHRQNKKAKAFESDPINSRLIDLNVRFQTQQIAKLMIEKVQFEQDNINKQMSRYVESHANLKKSLDEATKKNDVGAIERYSENIISLENAMEELTGQKIKDHAVVNVSVDFNIDNFKKEIQQAIEKNSSREEVNAIIARQLKKWNETCSEELNEQLRKIVEDMKGLFNDKKK